MAVRKFRSIAEAAGAVIEYSPVRNLQAAFELAAFCQRLRP